MSLADIFVSIRGGGGRAVRDAILPSTAIFAWASRVLVVSFVLLSANHVLVASADTVTVCQNGCDHTSIQAAVNAANGGETIVLLTEEHTECGILVDKDVTIVGGSASGTIVQAAPTGLVADDRVLNIDGRATVNIRDLTIRYGKVIGRPAQGGGILNYGELMLEGVTVTANQVVGLGGSPGAMAEGGGIYNAGVLTITHSTVKGNRVLGGEASYGSDGGDGHGGGIVNGQGAVLQVSNSTISRNAVEGGAGHG